MVAAAAAKYPGAMFSFDDVLNGSMAFCEWAGVRGVTGTSSPASDEAHEREPVEGDPDIHDPRFVDHEPEGARPGVGIPADRGVSGYSTTCW